MLLLMVMGQVEITMAACVFVQEFLRLPLEVYRPGDAEMDFLHLRGEETPMSSLVLGSFEAKRTR
jgi:hypothetical protein